MQAYPKMGSVPEEWIKAMLRAREKGTRAYKLSDGSFAVTSESGRGLHIVTMLPNGKIGPCDAQCPSRVICKHRGRVCMKILTGIFGEYAVRQLLARADAERTPVRQPAARKAEPAVSASGGIDRDKAV